MHEGEAQIVSGEQSALGMGTFNPMQCHEAEIRFLELQLDKKVQ